MSKLQEQALLEPRLVGDVQGEFYIPAYQRGYRWENDHVEMLLNDIEESEDQNYCLQPVVVKKLSDDKFELIDGQQRTTTLYLVFKYMQSVLPIVELKYNITYETRTNSTTFLKEMDDSFKNDNIDFYHIYNAYQTIVSWFDAKENKALAVMNMYKKLCENVKVIWYEVDTTIDATKLFTRLNIGKIPLTNAELVKALFLSKDNGLTEEKQIEVSASWDVIEKELQNNQLWKFLTNKNPEDYDTRIELIFDLMANKQEGEREKLFTFFYFLDKIKAVESSLSIWEEITAYFLTLKEWYEKRDIYHKVGYLVTIGESLQKIKTDAEGKTKTKFEEDLDALIINSLNMTVDDVMELDYQKSKDKEKIERLLTLHNVETIRLLKDFSIRYSFEAHKGKEWTLEHIHAQNAVGLNKKEQQQEWLVLHKKSLEALFDKTQNLEIEELIKRIEINYDNITQAIFDELFNKIFEVLSLDEDRGYIDTITNMALLNRSNNAALNNATFDVKRNKIIEIDKAGSYIPICTKRVFFKYYTDSKDYQLFFWGEEDRKAYLDSMIGEEGVLVKYLRKS